MGYLDTIEQVQGTKQKPVLIKREWLTAWRELAQITYGITNTDPRLINVLATLDRCDSAFARDDWQEFQQAASEVRTAVRKSADGSD